VVLDNVPSRTGCDVLPATVAGLREQPGIIGVKEAVGSDERIRAISELVRPDFVYLTGDDGTACQAMLGGAAGVISVVANLVPKAFRAFCDAATRGDKTAAERHNAGLMPLIEALNCAPNPIAVKAGLPSLGLGTAGLRLPLVELEDGPDRARILAALAGLASLADAA